MATEDYGSLLKLLQNQQQPSMMSLLPGIGGGLLSGLAGYFGGMDQRKQDNHWYEQAKDLYDKIRWGDLNKDVVSPSMLSMMGNRTRQSLAPTRANMLYGASRHAGLRSGQTWNMFDQNYTPIEAGMHNQNQQWGTGMNVQNKQFLQSLLTRLTGR